MISFRNIQDDEPGLRQSVLLQAVLLTIDYVETNGPVALTASKAFKRYFVEWAAEAFAWPYYTAADLYVANKVLNEHDFPPLVILHDLMLGIKLARHGKGEFALTRLAKGLKDRPADLWKLLASHLLLKTDHARYSRYGDPVVGNWDIFLNVINVEVHAGASEEQICSALYGETAEDFRRHEYRMAAAFYISVLRPLCWLGLLHEFRHGTGLARRETFLKGPLWSVALALETDSVLSSDTRH